MESLEDLGEDAHNQKKYPDAIQYYSLAIFSKPNDHTLYSKRAASYFNIQDYESAEADADKCIFLKGDWSQGYQLKAMVQLAKGDQHNAHKNISIAVALDANNTQTIELPTQIDQQITSEMVRDMKVTSSMYYKTSSALLKENMKSLVFQYINSRESQNQIANMFQKAKNRFEIDLDGLKN